ncbi:MAG TPA: hypothetical protein PKY86_06585 [Niabella sp.]|nr:hypothetical protein [Niabella sp.]HQW15460.1 hypothetical protein [Niabella sp.]HQX20602.1 hypothetical protein [Niabella sp.]HRB07006.1 hypothetical protein [Niabella sp.]HRB35812.1 hypothetical protein [Niabella sp.]
MKRVIIAFLAVTAMVVACSPKATKPAAVVASAEAGANIVASAKCTKCHGNETKHVAKYAFAEQERLFINMAGKAKLSWAETQDLMAFVKKTAKP